MNQRTHAWMAARAVALLEATGEAPGLVKLLKPQLRIAAVGAWIPDMKDAKAGGNLTDNHVFKIGQWMGSNPTRFVTKKDALLKLLGSERRTTTFLKKDTSLNQKWWATSFKADPDPGKHLANRAMGVTVTLKDLLTMGEPAVTALLPKHPNQLTGMDPSACSSDEQLALYFFMLSHFVADTAMPCHCDARKLAGYDKGVHNALETRWSEMVGAEFDKEKFPEGRPSDDILDDAINAGAQNGIDFPEKKIPNIKAKDVWYETVNLARASFAISSILVPPNAYPYPKLTDAKKNGKKAKKTAEKTTSLKKIMETKEGEDLVKELDKVILHDGVLNIAMVWKDVWKAFE